MLQHLATVTVRTPVRGLLGTDDMPAHVRSALTATQLSIPITGGALALGTWQGIYLWEHRLHGSAREVAVHVIGEAVQGASVSRRESP